MIGSEKTCHVANLLILKNGPVQSAGQKNIKIFLVYLVSLVHL